MVPPGLITAGFISSPFSDKEKYYCRTKFDLKNIYMQQKYFICYG